MFISAKPDSLSVVIVVRKYPLTSFKVLFARSLSAEVTGIVQAIRSKLKGVVRQNVTFGAMLKLCRSAKKDGQLKDPEKNEKFKYSKIYFLFIQKTL